MGICRRCGIFANGRICPNCDIIETMEEIAEQQSLEAEHRQEIMLEQRRGNNSESRKLQSVPKVDIPKKIYNPDDLKRMEEERKRRDEIQRRERERAEKIALTSRRIKSIPSKILSSLIGAYFLGFGGFSIIGIIIEVYFLKMPEAETTKYFGTYGFIGFILMFLYLFSSSIKKVK